MVTSAIMFESRGVLYTFKHSTNFPYKLHVLVRIFGTLCCALVFLGSGFLCCPHTAAGGARALRHYYGTSSSP
jgi:hypothetical protein